MDLSVDSSPVEGQGTPSGIDPIDVEWGGFYRGGSYLVYGRAASGRGLLALRFAAAGAERRQRCLFVTSERFRDLAVEASSIGWDLRRARMQGLVRLTRVPPVVSGGEDADADVLGALRDLAALIRREKTSRVVVNDFLPFVMFRSLDRFRQAFVEFLEALDGVDSTLIIALPEPANDQSARVVEFVSTKLTGTIHVEPFAYDPGSSERRLTLTPHMGHAGRPVVCRWDLSNLVQLPTPSREKATAVSDSPDRLATGPRSDAPRAVPEPRPVASEPAREAVIDVAEGRDPDEVTPLPAWPPERPIRETGDEKGGPAQTPEPADSVSPEDPSGAGSLDAERESFRARLESRFERRERGGVPFLLLAMRLDREADSATRPFDFEFIIDLVSDSLRSQDSYLVQPDTERLVVCLADSTPDDAQDFFARLRRTLEAEAPQRAAQLLHAVSAIVVPDGRPFPSAAEFLRYALDEE